VAWELEAGFIQHSVDIVEDRAYRGGKIIAMVGQDAIVVATGDQPLTDVLESPRLRFMNPSGDAPILTMKRQ